MRQRGGHVGYVHHIFLHKLRQIVLLGRDIESEVKVFRIHLADVQIGDITHHAHRQRRVELNRICFGWVSGGRFEFRQARVPTRPVVVVRRQSLLLRLLQNRNHLPRLRGWLHSADPRQRKSVGVIKFLHQLSVIAEIGPAQLRQISRLDD